MGRPSASPRLSHGHGRCDTADVPSLAALTVLAHQGGWDETLMVLTPIAVFALLLKMANTRAKRAAAESLEPPTDPTSHSSAGDPAGDPSVTDPATPDEPFSPA